MKTAKVRMAVAVTAAGCYSVAAWVVKKGENRYAYCGDDAAAEAALDTLDAPGPYAVRFVETEVELPEPVTVVAAEDAA